MKKILTIIFASVILSSLILLPPVAALATEYNWGNVTNFANKASEVAGFNMSTTDPASMVIGFTIFVFTLVGALFIAYFVYGGASWLLSGGNDEKIGKARKTMTYATMGVFICIAAYSIAFMVSNLIATTPAKDATTPNLEAGEGPGSNTTSPATCDKCGQTYKHPETPTDTFSQDCIDRAGGICDPVECSTCLSSSDQTCVYVDGNCLKQGQCDQCGSGLLNQCDGAECKALGDCIFCPTLLGGTCHIESTFCKCGDEPVQKDGETDADFQKRLDKYNNCIKLCSGDCY